MRELGLFPTSAKGKVYKLKFYEQMTSPGRHVQVNMKMVHRKCITDSELCLFQYTTIDKLTRLF